MSNDMGRKIGLESLGSDMNERIDASSSMLLDSNIVHNGYTPVKKTTKELYVKYGIGTSEGIPGEDIKSKNGSIKWRSKLVGPEGNTDTTDKYVSDMGFGSANSPVINPPFQFNEHDDVRSDGYYPKLGRIYNEDIRSNFPIGAFEVGRVKYSGGIIDQLAKFVDFTGDDNPRLMSKMIKGEKSLVTNTVAAIKGVVRGALELVTFPVKFLTGTDPSRAAAFVNDTGLYAMYVDETLAQLSVFMGFGKFSGGDGFDINSRVDKDVANSVEDEDKLNEGTENDAIAAANSRLKHGLAYGKELFLTKTYPGRMKTPTLYNILPGVSIASKKYIPFLLSKSVSTSESISNSTESNPLMSSVNEAAAAQQKKDATGADTTGNAVASIADMVKNKLKNVLSSIGKGESGYVMQGNGRMVLPNIWSNSTFSRSYSMTFDFRSPYGDDLSVFENVYIPLILLLVMASPRQIGKNSYTSPFVIRVSSRGWFNCPLGIITSMSIERGEDKNNWTITGKPSSVKVSMSIEDLTPSMMMGLDKGLFSSFMVNNDGFTSYLATLGGLSIADAKSLLQGLRRWADLIDGAIDNFGKGFFSRFFMNHSDNFVVKTYMWFEERGLFNKDDIRKNL